FAPIFDIDWPAQDGKVLVPTLAEPLRTVLDRGAASIADADADSDAASGAGELELDVDGQRFPLSPGSAPNGKAVLSPEELGELVARQHFRPAYWRVSSDEG